MPQGNPLGYLPPQVQSALIGAFSGPLGPAPPGVPTAMQIGQGQNGADIQSVLNSLLSGAGPQGGDLLAAGVKGFSLPAFRRTTDADVLQLQRSKNERNRAGAIREEAIRRQYGTWGVPGNVPVDPLIG